MLAKIPSWVFAVFFLLLFLGYRQSRTRLVVPGALAMLASAMFGLSLYGVVAGFGLGLLPLALWSIGMVTSVTVGAKAFAPRGMVGVPASSSIQIAGSWLPLALMMGIFVVKFALGFATAVGSAIVTQWWFVAVSCLAMGLLSGGFAARALAVRRFAVQAGGDGRTPAGAVVDEFAALVPDRLVG